MSDACHYVSHLCNSPSEYTDVDSEDSAEERSPVLRPVITQFNLDGLGEDYAKIAIGAISTEEFRSAKTMREQIGILGTSKILSKTKIAKLLGVNRSTITKQLRRYTATVRGVGRPPVFTDTEQMLLENFICERFDQGIPVDYHEIWTFVHTVFGKDVLIDMLRHFIRSCGCFKAITGIPMDRERVAADPSAIDYFYNELEMYLGDVVPPGFLLNIDETGMQEFVDAREQTIIVPIEFPKNSIFISKSRAQRRITLLGGIFGDGTTLKPLLIIPRATCDADLLKHGYDGSKVSIYCQENGFISSDIFDEWTESILIPEIRRRRDETGYIGVVILILDGCSCHTTDYFEDECLNENIVPIFLAPHSSDQCQPLDLLIFSLQKLFIQRIRPAKDSTTQTKEIIKILDSWQQATTPSNITASFKRAGLLV
jgi:hypothetical protein